MSSLLSFFFFFNDTATTEIYTLSLHDALPISVLTGSHIDTVPEGGILDGALGVLAGLEALETIRETNPPHRRPLAGAAWSHEENRDGSLFGSPAFFRPVDLPRVGAMAARDGARAAVAAGRVPCS